VAGAQRGSSRKTRAEQSGLSEAEQVRLVRYEGTRAFKQSVDGRGHDCVRSAHRLPCSASCLLKRAQGPQARLRLQTLQPYLRRRL